MKINKKHAICFLVIFFTLISCSLVSATDNPDNNTITTQNNEVTTRTVEQSQTNDVNDVTTTSTGNIIQSEDNIIEETDDQYDVEQETNNVKAINKAKITSTDTKTATDGTLLSNWNQITSAKSGTYYLNNSIVASGSVTLNGNLTIYGNGYTITGNGVTNLFEAGGSYKVDLDDVIITGVNGYVINGGSNHYLISSIFENNGGLWRMSGDSHIYIINCLIENSKNTRVIDGWTNKANGVQYYIYNSIFKNNPKPTIIQWNNANFHGFNFFVDGEFITNSTYVTYKGNLNKETDSSLSSYSFARQQTGSMDMYAISSPVSITITADDVYINQTNTIKVRLNATVGNEEIGYFNVGVPNEKVTITIKYINGSTTSLTGTTDVNGVVSNITDHNGVVLNQIKASQNGTVNVSVTYAGSEYKSDDGKQLYLPANASKTYNVLKFPTKTVLTVNATEAKMNDQVKITANVTNTVNNTTVVNDGLVKFYRGSTLIGNATVKNSIATFNYTVNSSGTNVISAVYYNSTAYNQSTSNTKNIEVEKANSYITLPSALTYYVGQTSNITVNVTTTGNNKITTGTVRFTLPDGSTVDKTVNDGRAVLDDYTFSSSGIMAISAKFLADNNYLGSSTGQTSVTVNKIPVTVTPTVTSNHVDNFVTEVTVNSDVTGFTVNSGTVTLYDSNNNIIGSSSVTGGKAVIENTSVSSRTNEIFTAVYSGSYQFNDNSGSTGETDVIKNTASITISNVSTLIVNQTVTINATLTYNSQRVANQKILFTFNDTTTGGTVTTNNDGVASINYSSTTGDKPVNVVASLVENDYYTANSANIEFNVDKIGTKTTIISVDDMQVGVPGNILVSLNTTDNKPVNGESVDLYINGNKVGSETTSNGIATFTYTPSTNETLNISAKYTATGSDVYKPSSTNGNTTKSVTRIPTVLVINDLPSMVNVSEEFTFKIKLTNSTGQPLNGKNIIVTINNKTINNIDSTDANGVTLVSYTPDDNTALNITAQFNGDNVYEGQIVTDKSLTSEKIQLIPTIVTITVPENGTVYTDIPITLTLTNKTGTSINGEVEVYVNDNYYDTVTLTNSAETINYNPQNNETLKIYAIYHGDNKVYSDNKTNEKTVKVNVIETKLIISAPSSVNVSESYHINISLTNKTQDNIITDKLSGIKVQVNDEDKQLYYDNTNLVYYIIDTPDNNSNDIKITAQFTGDNVYGPSEAESQINKENINRIPTQMTIILPTSGFKVGVEFEYKVNLTNKSGEVIPDQTVTSKIGENIITLTYDSTQKLYTGKYTPQNNNSITIESDYSGNNVYMPISAQTSVDGSTISLIDTIIGVDYVNTTMINSENIIKINLSDESLNKLNPENITVKINNTDIEFTQQNITDNILVIKYIPQNSGNLTVNVTYPGLNGVYSQSTKSVNINVTKIPTKLEILDVPETAEVSKEFTFKVKLTDKNSQSITGKTVKVTVNDEEITGLTSTDTNGVISVKYAPRNNTSIVIKAQFIEDETYLGNETLDNSLTTDKIKLIPTLATFTVNDKAKVGEELIITVNLTNNTSNPSIIPATVNLHINNQTIPINIIDSSVDYTYTPQDNTTLKIYVEYPGDNKVYSANTSNIKEVPVDLKQTSMEIKVPEIVKVSEEFTFNITLKDEQNQNIPDKTLTVTVNNQTIQVTYDIENNVYTGKYTPQNNTPINITAKYGGDNVYNASNATDTSLTSDKIKLIPTNIGINVPENIKVYEEFEIKLNLTNKTGNLITGKTLNVYINNELYTDIILTDGTATLYYTPKNNTPLEIKAEFLGDTVYNASTNDVTRNNIELMGTNINIRKDSDVKVGEEITVTINLTSDDNNLIDPTNITTTLTLNDEIITSGITRTVNNNILTIKYTPQEKGIVNVKSQYNGLTDIYTAATSKDVDVSVEALDTTLNVELGNLIATNTSNITVTVPESAKEALEGQTIYFNLTESDDTKHELTGTITDGKAIISITPNVSGRVTYNVSFVDNKIYGNYNNDNNEGNVNKMPVTLTIEADADALVGQTVNAKVILKDANGKYLDNQIVQIQVHNEITSNRTTNGIVEITYELTNKGNGKGNTGNINIHAKFDETNIYEGHRQVTKLINTHGINTTIHINTNKIKVQKENTATIQLVNTTTNAIISQEKVTITVKDEENNNLLINQTTMTDENGYINFVYKPLTTSKITINALYENTEVYNGNSSTKELTLNNNDFEFITPNITVTATNTTVYENNTITVTLTNENNPLNNQNVTIIVDGQSKTYNTDNNGQIIITNYTFDEYKETVPVTVQYDGNTTLGYNPTQDQTNFKVYRINTTITATITNNTAGNTTFNIKVQDNKSNNVPEGTVTLKTGEQTYTGQVINGTTTINITNLPIGQYDFTAEYAINKVYNSSSTNDNLEMAESLKNIEIVGRTANITYNENNNTYKNVTITVNLYDNITNENLTGENITVYDANGEQIGNGTIQTNGNTTIKLNLPVGENQPITIKYNGNNTYNQTEIQTTITVIKRNTTTKATVTNSTAGNVTIKVNVTDATTGEAITNGYVNITADGTLVGRAELSNGDDGIINVITNITSSGEYNIIANFEGNTNYTNSSTDLETITVNKRNATIDYSVVNNTVGNTTVNITVSDSVTGKPVVNGAVNITVNNTIVGTGTTDENGTAIINITVPITTTEINITYAGNDTYNENKTTGSIDLQKRDSTTVAEVTNNTAGNVTLNVDVTDAITSAPVPNGPVEVYANGTLVGTGSVVDGKSIVVTNITSNGTYDIVVKYLGNINYTESEVTLSDIGVVGRSSNITAEMTNTTFGNTTVNVTLVDPTTTEPIPNATVIVTLSNGTEVNGTTDENGTVTIPVDIPVGNNTLNVTYPGNETYNGTSTNVTVDVGKRDSTTVAEVANNTAGNVTIDVDVTDAVTGLSVPNGPVEIYANGTLVGNGTIANGKSTVITNITSNGSYDIVVKYLGNTNYTESNTTLENINVVGRSSNITVEVPNNTVGNTTINVTVVDPVTDEPIPNATVIVTLPNGTEVNGTTDENGTVTIPVDIPVGNNTLNVTYPGNETYNGTSTNVTVDVGKRNSTTVAEVTNNTAGNVTIDVDVTDATTSAPVPNGPVEVYANGTLVGNGSITNGKATIVTNITSNGTYDIVVKYLGNTNYTNSSYSLDDVSVVGRESNVTTGIPNATVGNTTINATIVDPVTDEPIPNATVIVTLPNGTEVNGTTDENGTVTIPVDIPVGNNTLNVTYPGNETYNGTSTNVTVDVGKRDSTTVATVTNNTAGNVTIDVDVTDATTGLPIPNGPVVVRDGNKVVGEGNITHGNVKIVTNITQQGKYNLTVEFKGNENYTNSSDIIKDVDVVGRKSEITSSVTNNTFGNTTIEVELDDPVTNEPISNATIIVTLPNGTKFNTTTNENGTVNIPVDIPVGDNNITITYPGDKTHNSTNTTIPVKVEPRNSTISVDVLNSTAGNTTIKVNITDSTTNKPVPNGTVNIYVNNTPVGTGKIVNGTVTIPTNITSVGPKEITVNYTGNNEYKANNKTVNVTITPRNTTLVAQESNNMVGNTTISVKLTDSTTKKPISNAPIQVINNKTVIARGTTDNNGKVTLPVNLPAGKYTVDVLYKDNSPYKNITQKLPITINKHNATLTPSIRNNMVDNTTIDVKVTDSVTGKPLTNMVLELSLPDGGKVKAITNDKAIATYNVNLSSGINKLNVKLLETSSYNEANTGVTVDVLKECVVVKVDEVKGIVGDKLVLRAHVTDLYGNKVTGGNLAFKINGKTVTKGLLFNTTDNSVYKVSVKNGIVEIKVTAYKKLTGAVNITASYSGSSTYNANKSDVSSMSVRMRTAQINVVTAKLVEQGSKIQFTARLSDTTVNSTNSYVNGGHVQFKLNGITFKDAKGKPVRVTVVNNVATYTYTVSRGTSAVSSITGAIKNYTVTASYDNKSYYVGIRNNTTYNVKQKAVKFTFNQVKVQKGMLSVKADLKDVDGKYVVGKNIVCIKINNKTYKENGKVKYFTVQNGKVNLSGINTNGNNVKVLTIVSGSREPYYSARASTTKIVTA